MSLRLSKKHGVNPSIVICPICKKDMHIALFGHLKGDAEAPRQIENVEPCDECKKTYLTIVEMKEGKEPKPTGRRCFCKRESIHEDYRDMNVLFMKVDDFSKLISNANRNI